MTRLRLAACVPVIAALAIAGCSGNAKERAAAERATGGDPVRGKAAIQRYGCASCHTIPGISGAMGLVGPPLGGIASRVYVGGVLPNTPDNMIRWIMHPQQVDNKSAMPELGVNEKDARDIAAYLQTLR